MGSHTAREKPDKTRLAVVLDPKVARKFKIKAIREGSSIQAKLARFVLAEVGGACEPEPATSAQPA